MSISIKTHKILWGRSGNRCSICKNELIADETSTDDESLIGEECHIISPEKLGPRGNEEIEDNNIDKYDNLILLCRNHHKIIDDQIIEYSVKKLHEIKKNHEDWVKKNLSLNDYLDKDDLLIATTLEKWEKLIHIDDWDKYFYGIVECGIPTMGLKFYNELKELKIFLFKRFKSNKYEKIENSLQNFLIVLHDFLNVFEKYAEEVGSTMSTRRFYKIDDWNPELYNELGDKYDFHVELLEDLLFELTKAANFIIINIIYYYLYNYRQEKGVLHIERGPDITLRVNIYRPEYENNNELYVGLEKLIEYNSKDLSEDKKKKIIPNYII